jgi:hypothetical protein
MNYPACVVLWYRICSHSFRSAHTNNEFCVVWHRTTPRDTLGLILTLVEWFRIMPHHAKIMFRVNRPYGSRDRVLHGYRQGCQMVYFQTKNPNLGTFWRALEWKMLVYFMAIW